jgi:hypothetical protein
VREAAKGVADGPFQVRDVRGRAVLVELHGARLGGDVEQVAGEALAVHVDLPPGELGRRGAELVLEHRAPLVEHEGGAEDPDDDDREREAHASTIGNRPRDD